MAITVPRPLRRSTRLRALLATAVVASAFAAAMPSQADAYSEYFCTYAPLGSGSNCYAGNRHTLQSVFGWSTLTGNLRVCTASFTAPYGSQNSDWHCDYGYTEKFLYGRVDGVGAIHNGDPNPFTAWAQQDF